MEVRAILEHLANAGLSVAVNEGRLLVMPRHLITDTMREIIGAHKAGLLAHLSAPAHADAAAYAAHAARGAAAYAAWLAGGVH